MRSRCAYCEHYTCTCRPEPKQSIQVGEQDEKEKTGSGTVSNGPDANRLGSEAQKEATAESRQAVIDKLNAPFKASPELERLEREVASKATCVHCMANVLHSECLSLTGSTTQTAEQERPLVDRLKDALRDYRDEHHAEHPSQPSKLDCAYTWCQRATRLLSAKESPAASQLDKYSECRAAWGAYPTQDNEGFVPDRAGFKAGFMAAWDILSTARPATSEGDK